MKAYKILVTIYAIIALVSVFLIGYGISITMIGILSVLYFVMLQINTKYKLDKTKTLVYVSIPVLILPIVNIVILLIDFDVQLQIFIILVALFSFNVYAFITNLKQIKK